ncbi:cytochrome oxidase biogenesis protein Surf1, facilitates heme A insertion [Salipiger aestuarii]|uniref:SURF1 family protein n=1 Tax=Salipiger aestuarii TaxID=568098 RepID=UPI00025B6B5F|nr:SURF1 family protein [Salipiger aestuarii]EIE48904.1 SURF1 family protein [Citreicella sp. 357]KAA8610343.1 cytochrome oxidase biogenesis protein Surf1, facilitates heme A insertion [Salipiger aestuarii]KAA8616359.1 cytochrome oxidase biogenesis protein Surf1, facilitates heme A insertion [Salipiger aestuarii]KAB2543546.1 cytochrome oxidase biogenesis protein Surf1, facilitates heme A insertion [Salipiger aestuarii]
MSRFTAPLLFGLIGAGILVALGTWQMQRLDEKLGILAQIESRISGPPEPLPVVVSPADQKYQPVALQGEILPAEIRILVSRKQVGAGYLIVSPFRTKDRLILLDRGFTRAENKDAARTSGPAEVVGNLHWPDDRNSATPENDVDANIWFARDIAAMAEQLGTEPLLVVARKIDPQDPDIEPMPVDTAGIPNDHLQYAITWYSLAVVWLGMTAYYISRQRKTGET